MIVQIICTIVCHQWNKNRYRNKKTYIIEKVIGWCEWWSEIPEKRYGFKLGPANKTRVRQIHALYDSNPDTALDVHPADSKIERVLMERVSETSVRNIQGPKQLLIDIWSEWQRAFFMKRTASCEIATELIWQPKEYLLRLPIFLQCYYFFTIVLTDLSEIKKRKNNICSCDICHRRTTLRKLYFVILTYFMKVKHQKY